MYQWDWDNFGLEESDAAVDAMLAKYNAAGPDHISFEEYAIMSMKRLQR